MREKCKIAISVVWITALTIWMIQESAAQSVSYKALGKNHRLTPVPNLYVTGLVNPQPGALTPQSLNEVIPNVIHASSIGGGMTLVQTSQPIPFSTLRAKKAARMGSNQSYIYSVYQYPGSNLQIYPRPEIVVCIREGADIQAIAERYHLTVIRALLFTNDQYILGLDASSNPFSVSDIVGSDPDVVWSNPNLARQIEKRFKPNDPLYPNQWHLNNTGQNGAKAGADISAEAAWDLQKPNKDIVIAIVDDSVDLNHPDLSIYTNPIEKTGTAGVDDDKNGLIDDIHGWDFANNDNNPGPDNANESHGTSVAGVAAAIGNNGIGVVGASYGSVILPVKIGFGEDGVEPTEEEMPALETSIAEAVRYAAKYGDIMNNSWGGPVLSDVVSSALDFAASDQAKRGAKGVPVLFASGNDASWFQKFESSAELEPGTYTIVMSYGKDASGKGGDDRVLIENAWFENQENGEIASIYPTDTNFPEGVSSDGGVPFTIQPSKLSESGYVYQSGAIGNNQYSDLIWEVEITENAYFYMTFRISSEKEKDGLSIYLNEEPMEGGVAMSDDTLAEQPYTGEPPSNIQPIVGECTHPKIINIGASNDQDVRSLYSQWGPELKFMAPSNGGNNEITTTDVSVEGLGYDPNSAYASDFGGTSSACPLAVGSFALVMAAYPDISVAQLMDVFKKTTDKIGDLSYNANGFNEQYGYGRINLEAAVKLALQMKGTAVSAWELY